MQQIMNQHYLFYKKKEFKDTWMQSKSNKYLHAKTTPCKSKKKQPNFAAYSHGVIGLLRTANIPTEAIAAHIIYNL